MKNRTLVYLAKLLTKLTLKLKYLLLGNKLHRGEEGNVIALNQSRKVWRKKCFCIPLMVINLDYIVVGTDEDVWKLLCHIVCRNTDQVLHANYVLMIIK